MVRILGDVGIVDDAVVVLVEVNVRQVCRAFLGRCASPGDNDFILPPTGKAVIFS